MRTVHSGFKQCARGEHSLIIAILANSSIRQWQHSSTTGSATCLTKIPASELHARHQARHRCSHAIMQPPSCNTGYCMAWSCLDHRDQLSHLDGAIFLGYFFRVVAWAAWLTLTISAETDHDRIPCDQ